MAGLKKRVLKRAAKAGVRKGKREMTKARYVRDLGTSPKARDVQDVITGGPLSAMGRAAAHGALTGVSAMGKKKKKR